jgi:Lipoprotein LpqB beta-propeller domain
MSARRWLVVLAIGASAVLSACSGVPTNSSPEVIGPVAGGVSQSSAAIVTPQPGSDPRSIVLGFLDANVSNDSRHTGARTYLTSAAAKSWTDTTTSVVGSTPLTGTFNLQNNSVTVTANKVGTLDAHGIYTPVTEGSGSTPITLTFGLTQVSGQWRINTLNNGLIVDLNDFQQTYKPRPVYFFDQSQKRLVPDLRYSPLTDQTLCGWLLDQLIAGPRAELQSAYTSNLPEQNAHAVVTFGQTIAVNLPGSSQLDAATRTRLAVQLAFTFALEFVPAQVVLSDGTKQVSIPQTNQPFTSQSFPSYQPSSTPANVYYLHDGAVVAGSGVKVGSPATGLTSIAIAARGSSNLLAATSGKSDSAQLLVGSLNGSLTATNVPAGPLSRPAWAPGLQEVWIGDGLTLYRMPTVGAPAVAVTLASSSGSVTGQIRSVAFSPDGVRIALVIKGTEGGSQLWIGTIVRTPDGASVQSLEPVTPTDLDLTDVAWNDANTLYAVGGDAGLPGGYGIWSVQLDGSLLTARSTTGLPSAPDSITPSQSGFAWVSANSTVWVSRGQESSWTAPGGGPGTTSGTSPNYVE